MGQGQSSEFLPSERLSDTARLSSFTTTNQRLPKS